MIYHGKFRSQAELNQFISLMHSEGAEHLRGKRYTVGDWYYVYTYPRCKYKAQHSADDIMEVHSERPPLISQQAYNINHLHQLITQEKI